MSYEYKHVRRVQFRETDAAGIVHFANFFGWMEEAEHAFFRGLGFSVHEGTPGAVGWPRVSVRCDYAAPLRFEDEAEIHLLVKEKRAKALTYLFIIRKIEGEARIEVARGEITAVCVAWDESTGKMKAITIPAELSAKIEVAPREMLA